LLGQPWRSRRAAGVAALDTRPRAVRGPVLVVITGDKSWSIYEAALDDALYRESHRCYCVANFNGRDPFAVIEIVGARHQTPNSDEAGPE
jgi:hypothetical protein